MQPEAEARHNPEAQPNPYAQIPDLVRKSLLSKPKDARRAQGELLHLAKTSKYFDPVVIAASYIQNIIIQPRQEARRIKDGLDLLNNIIMQGTGQNEPSSKKAEISVKIGPETVAAAKSIEESDRLVKKSKFISSLLPSSYEYLMGITSGIQKGAEQGKNLITIVHIERPQDGSPFSLEPYNLWTDKVGELLLQKLDEPKKEVTSKICDGLIDLLKQEPEQGLPERKKLYTRKHGEVSLEDMEQMEYPLSEENFDKITDFLVLGFSDNASPLYGDDIAILRALFSHQTIFDEITGHISIRNQNILAIINNWQENFVDQLLFGDDEGRKSQIKDLLKEGAPNIDIVGLIWDIPQHFRGDPSYGQESHHGHGTLDRFSSHPITYRYLKEFLERDPHPSVTLTKYPDEVGREYLGEVVIPSLRERLIDIGVYEELKEKMTFLENYVKENPYSKTHLETIKTVFKINAGDYFLDRLNEHTEEMEDIAKAVWEEIYQKGAHFLPLSKGSEVIEFSSDSVPSLLGLRSIEFTTPDPQKGEVLVRFAFLNMAFALLSTLDLKEEENMLRFKAPLQDDNHGLYTILNLISTLAMRDLVTQEIDRREPRHGNLPTKTKWQELIKWLKNPFSTFSEKSEKDIYQSLPRTRIQKDQDVISSIHKDFPQRRVSVHRRALSGAQNYWNIVGEYVEAFAKKDEERIPFLEGEVEDARKKLYRISKEKIANLPPMFRLETMEDPITSEGLYLETWVIEHTSPKPTPEELASPLQLFKRYYKNSSALAFLDQMKPWFVGQ